MLFQILRNLHPGFIMSPDPHIQCTQAANCKPSLHRPQDAPEPVPLDHQPSHQLLVPGDQYPSGQVAVPADVFRHGMHDNVDSHIQRFLEYRRGICIVNIRLDPVLLRQFCDPLQVNDGKQQGRRALQNDQIRLRADCLFEILQPCPTDIGHRHIHLFDQEIIQQMLHRTIAFFQADDMASHLADCHDRRRTCSHPRGKCNRPDAVLQRRQLLLQNRNRRIRCTPIVIFILKNIHGKIFIHSVKYMK